MDVREYRRRYEAELAADNVTAARSAAVPAEPPKIPDLIATLQDEKASTAARLAALHELLSARFLGARFTPYNAEFLAALRAVAQPGTDRELSEPALEVLASDKDLEAQQLLRRGLEDPKAALVSPAKALQLLAFDAHSGAADLARKIFHDTTDTETKEEALRVLASDPKSADLFSTLLKDKNQPRSIRALSATGLNHVSPQTFVEVARTIARDAHDYDDIHATVMGALAHAADRAQLPKDQGFVQGVKELAAKTSSLNVRSAAGRLLDKLQE